MTARCYRCAPWSDLRHQLAPGSDPSAPDDAVDLDARPATRQWIVREREGERELAAMRWGLIPYHYRGKRYADLKITNYNTRLEDAATHTRTAGSFERRRCLISASGWF